MRYLRLLNQEYQGPQDKNTSPGMPLTLQPLIEKLNNLGEMTQAPGDWLILTE